LLLTWSLIILPLAGQAAAGAPTGSEPGGALLPIQMSSEFQWMAWHPDDFGPRFNICLVFKPVLPALVKKPIFD